MLDSAAVSYIKRMSSSLSLKIKTWITQLRVLNRIITVEEHELRVAPNTALLYVWILIEDKGINICTIKALNKVKLKSATLCTALTKMMNSRSATDSKSTKNP